MNARDRFLATCRFEPVDRPFRWETIGFWPETIARWHKEGLPEEAEELSALVHFGMDLRMLITLGNFDDPGLYPRFEEQVVEETEHYRIRKTRFGTVIKEFKGGQSALPQFLEFPVRDMRTFEEIKRRLDPATPKRLGNDWDYSSQVYNESDFPVFVYVCGLFGLARHLLGFENLMLAYYDMPGLIHAAAGGLSLPGKDRPGGIPEAASMTSRSHSTDICQTKVIGYSHESFLGFG